MLDGSQQGFNYGDFGKSVLISGATRHLSLELGSRVLRQETWQFPTNSKTDVYKDW